MCLMAPTQALLATLAHSATQAQPALPPHPLHPPPAPPPTHQKTNYWLAAPDTCPWTTSGTAWRPRLPWDSTAECLCNRNAHGTTNPQSSRTKCLRRRKMHCRFYFGNSLERRSSPAGCGRTRPRLLDADGIGTKIQGIGTSLKLWGGRPWECSGWFTTTSFWFDLNYILLTALTSKRIIHKFYF